MILILILLVVPVFFIFRRAYAGRWSRDLDFRVRFSAPYVHAGEDVQLFEIIENRKKLPLPILEAAFRIPRGVFFRDTENLVVSDYHYKRDIFSLRGMESVTRTYVLECRSRGRYPVSQASCRAFSLLQSRQYTLDYPQEEILFVYPARADVSRVLSACDSLLGTLESSRRLYEDPFSFASIRDYTVQDPMKTINWKASARTGGLMVNTFTQVQDIRMLIFLDVEDRSIVRNDELHEALISLAATLCEKLTARGQTAGLYVNTAAGGHFPPRRGRESLQAIEKFLTQDFQKCDMTDFRSFLENMCAVRKAGGVPEDHLLVFLTGRWDDAREEAAKRLISRESKGLLVMPDPQKPQKLTIRTLEGI